jgi:hypothetical protein
LKSFVPFMSRVQAPRPLDASTCESPQNAERKAPSTGLVSGSRNGRPHGRGRNACLAGMPVAGVPVPLEERLVEAVDVADVVEELEHPERLADLVPAECRRRDLLLEVPGEIERVGAVEHAEVVGLAPDHLLLAGADRERNVPQLQVDVRLAELVIELERVALVAAQAVELQVVRMALIVVSCLIVVPLYAWPWMSSCGAKPGVVS